MTMEKKLNSAMLNLLFAKTNLVNQLKQNIASQSNDIVTILDRWLDDHKDEIKEHYEEPIEWSGDWTRLDGDAAITLEFHVGSGDDSYRQRIHVFPDGHWEFPKHNELNDKRME